MSQFNQQIIAAKKQQTLLYIKVIVLFSVGVLIVLTALFVSRGSRIEVHPNDAAELASISIDKGISLLIGDTLYSISSSPALTVSAKGFEPAQLLLNDNDFGKLITVTLTPFPAKLDLNTNINNKQTSWLINDALITTAAFFKHQLAAGDYKLSIAHPYYKNISLALSLARGELFKKTITLTPVAGSVSIHTQPQGAKILINGTEVGVSPIELPLQGGVHSLEIRLHNYQTIISRVEINNSQPTIEINQPLQLKQPKLLSSSKKIVQKNKSVSKKITPTAPTKKSATPNFYTHKAGGKLKLFTPNDSFIMGAARSERGQRANEFVKKIRLNKAFYAGVTEVSYQQYRQYNPAKVGIANQPVSSILWIEAASFCNWLSQLEGLPLVYQINKKQLISINQSSNGYRLLTEAEWEWLARKAGKVNQSLFVWGNQYVIPKNAVNIADESTKGSVKTFVPQYNDGFQGVASVKSFSQEKSGLYDFGGNVSEWVHDAYSIKLPKSGKVFTNPFSLSTSHSHVVKGANWRSGTITELRPSFREGLIKPRDDLGFRIGRYVSQGN